MAKEEQQNEKELQLKKAILEKEQQRINSIKKEQAAESMKTRCKTCFKETSPTPVCTGHAGGGGGGGSSGGDAPVASVSSDSGAASVGASGSVIEKVDQIADATIPTISSSDISAEKKAAILTSLKSFLGEKHLTKEDYQASFKGNSLILNIPDVTQFNDLLKIKDLDKKIDYPGQKTVAEDLLLQFHQFDQDKKYSAVVCGNILITNMPANEHKNFLQWIDEKKLSHQIEKPAEKAMGKSVSDTGASKYSKEDIAKKDDDNYSDKKTPFRTKPRPKGIV